MHIQIYRVLSKYGNIVLKHDNGVFQKCFSMQEGIYTTGGNLFKTLTVCFVNVLASVFW